MIATSQGVQKAAYTLTWTHQKFSHEREDFLFDPKPPRSQPASINDLIPRNLSFRRGVSHAVLSYAFLPCYYGGERLEAGSINEHKE